VFSSPEPELRGIGYVAFCVIQLFIYLTSREARFQMQRTNPQIWVMSCMAGVHEHEVLVTTDSVQISEADKNLQRCKTCRDKNWANASKVTLKSPRCLLIETWMPWWEDVARFIRSLKNSITVMIMMICRILLWLCLLCRRKTVVGTWTAASTSPVRSAHPTIHATIRRTSSVSTRFKRTRDSVSRSRSQISYCDISSRMTRPCVGLAS